VFQAALQMARQLLTYRITNPTMFRAAIALPLNGSCNMPLSGAEIDSSALPYSQILTKKSLSIFREASPIKTIIRPCLLSTTLG
jgi:hypothetical protein